MKYLLVRNFNLDQLGNYGDRLLTTVTLSLPHFVKKDEEELNEGEAAQSNRDETRMDFMSKLVMQQGGILLLTNLEESSMFADFELLVSRASMYVQVDDTVKSTTQEFTVKMDISMATRGIITPDIVAAKANDLRMDPTVISMIESLIT